MPHESRGPLWNQAGHGSREGLVFATLSGLADPGAWKQEPVPVRSRTPGTGPASGQLPIPGILEMSPSSVITPLWILYA